jgi:hypothetical protein
MVRHSLVASTSRTESDILDSAQMKKKIALIVFGSLFAVVALVAALFYLKGPFVGFPGSRTADGSRAVTDGGVKVAGWTGNVDAAEQKAGMSIRDAKLAQEARHHGSRRDLLDERCKGLRGLHGEGHIP